MIIRNKGDEMKRKIYIITLLLILIKIIPQTGLYTYIFDRGDYKSDYSNPKEIITDINELTPRTKKKALQFIAACNDAGLYPKITETYRTQERQDMLYEQGRSKPGKIVTWTRNSRHTKRYAFDIAKSGKNPYDDEEFFKKCAEIGRDLGLTAGYYWKNNQDSPHFQLDIWWAP